MLVHLCHSAHALPVVQVLHPQEHAELDAAFRDSNIHGSMRREIDLLKAQLNAKVTAPPSAPPSLDCRCSCLARKLQLDLPSTLHTAATCPGLPSLALESPENHHLPCDSDRSAAAGCRSPG